MPRAGFAGLAAALLARLRVGAVGAARTAGPMPKYYAFTVSLQGIEPRIWRQLLVRATSSFAELHAAIQDSFGWHDCHLWMFRTSGFDGRPIAGVPDDFGFADRPTPDASAVRLSEFFMSKAGAQRCAYVYDFGDDWTHEVKLLGVRRRKEAFGRRLIGGARNGPAEDCGGLPGYERAVEFRRAGNDPWGEGADLAEFLGDWQPDGFDLAQAKAAFDR